MTWRPIETRPDDTLILVRSGKLVSCGMFESDTLGGGFWHFFSLHEFFLNDNPPDAWMPIPESEDA